MASANAGLQARPDHLGFTIAVSLLVFGVPLLFPELYAWIPSPFLLLACIVLAFAFVLATGLAIGSAISRRWKPLLVIGLTLGLWAATPLSRFAQGAHWWLYRSAMERVVAMVERNDLRIDDDVATLPPGYESVSLRRGFEGRGLVQLGTAHGSDRPIFFYTFLAPLGHYHGIAYLPDDRFDGEFHCREARRLAPK